MSKRKTTEEYKQELAIKNPNLEVIGDYINNHTSISHRCKKHNIIYDTAPNQALNMCGCRQCANEKISNKLSKKHKQYVVEVAGKRPDIEVLGTYINAETKISHRCKKCNFIWEAFPATILHGTTCPECDKRTRSNKLRWSHEYYVDRLHNILPMIDPDELYLGSDIKIWHTCHVCNSKLFEKPHDLFEKKTCSVCNGRVIGSAPEYKNSIWASEEREFFAKYMTEEQMKEMTPGSDIKISMKCPDCQNIKNISPHTLVAQGLGCPCCDGQSYPNKFVYNVLQQLGLNVHTEYSPQWANGKRYDDYLLDYNIIIENHGLQHYKDGCFVRTLEEERENDKIKRQLAINNGVNTYIVIDCQRSKMDWIKKSIMSSELPSIFCFTESDIDWLKASEYATRSLIKTVSDLYNREIAINEICQSVGRSKNTVYEWLKIGTSLGWCDYIPKKTKSIYCIEINQIFRTGQDCATYVCLGNPRASRTAILRCCKINQTRSTNNLMHAYKHPHTNVPLTWLFVEDAIILGYITS